MALLQSGRVVHLNNMGEVIWEEWPNPSDKITDEQSVVLHREWITKAPKYKRVVPKPRSGVPVTASTVGGASTERVGGFGYDYSLVPRGRHYKKWGLK